MVDYGVDDILMGLPSKPKRKKKWGKDPNAPPTRGWKFGLLPPVQVTRERSNGLVLETLGPDLVYNHLWLAHKYYNTLIEIYRAHHTSVEEVHRQDTKVTEIETKLTSLIQEIKDTQSQQKKANSQARKKNADPSFKEALKPLRSQAKKLKAELSEAKTAARAAAASQISALLAERADRIKAARANSGLHDGTYLLVEASANQATKESLPLAPKFKPISEGFGRVGRLGQQIKSSTGILTSKSVFSGRDGRARLTEPDERGHCVLKLRFASDPENSKIGIWAHFPMTLHRLFPDDAKITNVVVTRRRIGRRWRWDVVFSVESEEFRSPRTTGTHRAAIDLGWSVISEGSNAARLGYLVGTDGRCGAIELPRGLLQALTLPNVLRSKRDKAFDEIRPKVLEYLDNSSESWLHEKLKSLGKHKSSNKLQQVVFKWREDRIEGDESIFPLMEAWAHQDRHLQGWECDVREKSIRARDEWYKVLASRLRKTYSEVVFEDLELSKMARSNIGATMRQLLAPGRFRDIIRDQTLPITPVNPAGTSRTCSDCKGEVEWERSVYKFPTCLSCGAVWDRDFNAAINILYASGAVLAEPLDSLELQELQGLPAPQELRGPEFKWAKRQPPKWRSQGAL